MTATNHQFGSGMKLIHEFPADSGPAQLVSLSDGRVLAVTPNAPPVVIEHDIAGELPPLRYLGEISALDCRPGPITYSPGPVFLMSWGGRSMHYMKLRPRRPSRGYRKHVRKAKANG